MFFLLNIIRPKSLIQGQYNWFSVWLIDTDEKIIELLTNFIIFNHVYISRLG